MKEKSKITNSVLTVENLLKNNDYEKPQDV
jgi:hypothetical protein